MRIQGVQIADQGRRIKIMFFGIAIKLKEFGKDFLIGGVFLVDLRDCRVWICGVGHLGFKIWLKNNAGVYRWCG